MVEWYSEVITGMRKILALGLFAIMLIGVSTSIFAAPPAREEVEKTGLVDVKMAEKGEKFNTITIKVGEEVFKLLPGKEKKLLPEIEKLAGKEITVKGSLLPADAKHPLAAIKVDSYTVKEATGTPQGNPPADASGTPPAGK